MINDTTQWIIKLAQSDSAEQARDVLLKMGFNGVVFQRWYPDVMDNWEGHLAEGFLELYYASQMYTSCPIANAIHRWSRDFTFRQARDAFFVGDENAQRVKALYQQFGMEDGVVMLSGSNESKSALILTSDHAIQPDFERLSATLAFAARSMDQFLPPMHSLLTRISRGDPTLSDMQNRILQLQIDHPELSNTEMAQKLGMSPKTLHSHHKRIAKKTGVTTFAGAVIKRMRDTPVI